MLLQDPNDIDRGPNEPAVRRPIVVQKYGGSSVADVNKLGRVADRVVATRRAGRDVVVVVSAMGKTTDGLLSLAAEVAAGGDPGSGVNEPPRRELDMLVSTGERVAMSLLSIAIQARGIDAISFTGSQCGIITNDRHFDARIIEVRPHRIEDELARGRIVIVAGYQGMSYKREITTLGRGGTDTTAVALAAALEAERCEIYSDVDGVYSADPRSVPNAQHLPEVDCTTLQEMSVSGAKVLCAQAVEWVQRSGVAVYARSTFNPISDAPKQTLVRKFGPTDKPHARAVTCDRHVALLELRDQARMPQLLEALATHALAAGELNIAASGCSLLLALRNAPDWAAARPALLAVGETEIHEGVALVSVVGDGLTDRPDALASFRGALTSVGCEPQQLSASPLRLSAVIDEGAVEEAQRKLHATFVE